MSKLSNKGRVSGGGQILLSFLIIGLLSILPGAPGALAAPMDTNTQQQAIQQVVNTFNRGGNLSPNWQQTFTQMFSGNSTDLQGLTQNIVGQQLGNIFSGSSKDLNGVVSNLINSGDFGDLAGNVNTSTLSNSLMNGALGDMSSYLSGNLANNMQQNIGGNMNDILGQLGSSPTSQQFNDVLGPYLNNSFSGITGSGTDFNNMLNNSFSDTLGSQLGGSGLDVNSFSSALTNNTSGMFSGGVQDAISNGSFQSNITSGVTQGTIESLDGKLTPLASFMRNVETTTFDPPSYAKKAQDNYSGTSQELYGFRRTDKAFGAIVPGELERTSSVDAERHTYPMLTMMTKYVDKNQSYDGENENTVNIKEPSLLFSNMAVDDEILKSQMMVFQNVADIEQSFLRDEKTRDRYLDMLNTVRAIAHMTLSYLDRTVAAGLSTIQQQADMSVNNFLLKQISWHTKEIANPERKDLYNDVDGKFEACMWSHGWANNGSADDYEGRLGGTKKAFDKWTEKDAKDPYLAYVKAMCSDPNDSDNECGKLYDASHSLIHYCTCCAERSLETNQGTNLESLQDDSIRHKSLCGSWAKDTKIGGQAIASGDDVENAYSMVERVLFGLGRMEGELENQYVSNEFEASDLLNAESQMVYLFEDMYGDYCTVKSHNRLKRFYHFPRFSVEQQVKIIRDGQPEECEGGNGYFFCSGDNGDGELKYGICPAFQQILAMVREDKFASEYESRQDEIEEMWKEASLAFPLTIDDFINVKEQAAQSESYNNEEQMSFVDHWCDAAAIVAYEKIHNTMVKLAEDHLSLNTTVRESERAMIHRLTGRVDQALAMANAEAGMNPAAAALLEVAKARARKEKAEGSAAASSSGARTAYDRLNSHGFLGGSAG
ncbi:MAG: hypothetical protein PHC51_00570 [bacterium]|nr:hypothetical protein [bacterium]